MADEELSPPHAPPPEQCGGDPVENPQPPVEATGKKFDVPVYTADKERALRKDYDWKEWNKSGGVMWDRDYPTGILAGVEGKGKDDKDGFAVIEFKHMPVDDNEVAEADVYATPMVIPPPLGAATADERAKALPVVTVVVLAHGKPAPKEKPSMLRDLWQRAFGSGEST